MRRALSSIFLVAFSLVSAPGDRWMSRTPREAAFSSNGPPLPPRPQGAIGGVLAAKPMPAFNSEAHSLRAHPSCDAGDAGSASNTVVVVGGGLAGLSGAFRAPPPGAQGPALGRGAALPGPARPCPRPPTGPRPRFPAGPRPLPAPSPAAALEADARGARVILIEKEPQLGGNSAKASSGMNATTPASGDTDEAFYADTLASGGGRASPDLVAAMVGRSAAALARLEALGLDLSTVSQLGGHSAPRTHVNARGPNVGRYLTSRVAAEVAGRGIEVRTGTPLREILVGGAGVEGVLVGGASAEDADAACIRAGAVVLATGGFGAGREMLERFAPAAAGLPTSNGPQATGDGLLAALRAGAGAVDLDMVQVHPTGFVDPADPGSGTKFLAPERLRGAGAVLLGPGGARFVDELTTRDRVTAAIRAQPAAAGSPLARGEAWLVLPAAGREAYGAAAVDFYASRGLFVRVEGARGLAEHLGAEESAVGETLRAYNHAARGHLADRFGKTVFPAEVDSEGPLWVSRVTPVVHYCMGGVRFDEAGRVLDAEGGPLGGLFAAGEVTGGLHGRNRLGGNSLLECAAMGHVAGGAAADHVRAAGGGAPGAGEL